jgi:hypothetical protein
MRQAFGRMLVIVLALGITVIACDNGNGGNGQTYTITIGELTNGLISANPTSGVEGTGIILTVTPNGGYKLKAGTLKYGTTTINETTKKFNLPASNVTVIAEFVLIETNSPLEGTWINNNANNGDSLVFSDNKMLSKNNSGNKMECTFTYTESNFEATITAIWDNSLSLSVGQKITYEYIISGDQLTLDPGGGAEPYQFTKQTTP